jgi:hypothetical protein
MKYAVLQITAGTERLMISIVEIARDRLKKPGGGAIRGP